MGPPDGGAPTPLRNLKKKQRVNSDLSPNFSISKYLRPLSEDPLSIHLYLQSISSC